MWSTRVRRHLPTNFYGLYFSHHITQFTSYEFMVTSISLATWVNHHCPMACHNIHAPSGIQTTVDWTRPILNDRNWRLGWIEFSFLVGAAQLHKGWGPLFLLQQWEKLVSHVTPCWTLIKWTSSLNWRRKNMIRCLLHERSKNLCFIPSV